jgi:uncharacterized protein DUF481
MNLGPISRSWTLRRTILALAVLLVAVPASAKRKDDVVVMKNGDRFTGEIKGLTRGELGFKSDYMDDTVYLDWRRVAKIESKDSYIVTLRNGERFTGGINETPSENVSSQIFQVKIEDTTRDFSHVDVISIQQNEKSFLHKLTGYVNYGLSFASANRDVNSSLGAQVGYSSSKNFVQLATSSQFNAIAEGANSNRFTLDFEYIRTLAPLWGVAGLYSLLKSNEQDLDLRSVYGGGISRKLYQSDRTSLRAVAGAVYSREGYNQASGTVLVGNNAEGLLALRYSTFRFHIVNIGSSLSVFPGITDTGRVRLSSQSNLQIELFRNFSWIFQLYENFDSHPPVTAPRNDLGVTTSLGWTF